ncbi:hypothetical protein HYR69_08520, partial [Candidatus Sumerlaeota bacterium]|nr:hypothetical protein [Candidatus Sumerlaeota bacterium]
MPQLKTCLAASLLGAMALLAGCRSVPTNEDLSAISTETLDYRNGWFHWASGTETVRSIAETYRRDPLLVAELNRSQQDSIPEAGKAIYVPPIHDRAKLKEILTRIGEHPETVPTIPPKPEMLGIAPKEAAAAPAEAAPVQSPQPVPDEKPATPQPPTPETPAAEPPPAPPPVT